MCTKLPEIITINDELHAALGWYDVFGIKSLVISKIESPENYTYIRPSSLTLFKLSHLFSLSPTGFTDVVDDDYKQNNLFKITEEYNFKLNYDLKDKWVGYLFNKANDIVSDIELPDCRILESGACVITNPKKYINNQVEFKEILIEKDQDLKNVLDYESDYLIVRHLKHPLVKDINGRLRFQEQELTEKEKEANSDLNKAWHDYYDKKFTFQEMLTLYMKIGYSVDGFMEVYYECFLKPLRDDEDEECTEDEIIKIISGEMKPFSKNR